MSPELSTGAMTATSLIGQHISKEQRRLIIRARQTLQFREHSYICVKGTALGHDGIRDCGFRAVLRSASHEMTTHLALFK
jgi:hypothetical protein